MNFSKLFQPKLNPFRLFIYSQKEGTITLKTFSPEKMTSSKLSNLNPGFTYCNSYNDLFVSEGNDFWIINHTSFQIRYKKMPIKKNNHSLIFVPCPNCQSGEGKIFIVGGENKKSFYFDLKKNYFINWAETNELHKNPALIKIGDYLYIFDSGKNNKLIFERTKLTDNKKQWEKIIPNYDENIIKYFPSENFAASLDSNGRIIFIGGNNINMENNNTFIYDINQNKIYLSEKGTNDNMHFVDKTFYFIDNQYNVALPEELEESREIAFVDKREQSLIKTNIGEIAQSISKDKSDYKQKNLLQFFKRDKNEENNKNKIVKNYNTPKEFGYCVSYYSYEKAKIKAKNDNIKVIEVQKNIATIPKNDLKVEIEKELKELKEIKENIKIEENYIDNKIEEPNVEQKVEENIEQNIVENAEQKVEENMEQNVEQNIEENVEQKVEENVEQNIEENAEQKQEENVEHNVEENIEQNVEQKVEPEIENNIEQNAEQNYEPNIEKIELPEQIEQNNTENIENRNEENILESKEEEHFEQVQENQEIKKEQEEPIQVKENEQEQEPLQEKQEEQEHIPEQENINKIPLEEINTDINQNAENIKQEEQNIEHEEEHYEEHIEQKEENENQEENEEHVEEHVEENIEEHVEEHLEEHDEQVEQKPEEENVEEHYEEEHNEEHYEQQIDANENQQVPEHENIENGGENEEEHIEQQDNNLIHEEENIEMKENLNQQVEDINIKPEEEEHQHEEPQEQIEEHQEIHENENEQNPNPEEVQEQYQENQNEVDIEKLNKHLDDIIERKIKEEIKPIEALIETKVEEDPNKVSIKKEENIDIIEEDAKVHIQMQNQLEFNNDQIQTESHHENENAENVENEEHFDSQGEENAEEEHQENIEEMEEMNFEEENNEEDNNEYGEEEQVEERDTFQKTLTQSIGEDVMQIPEQPIQIYYDAENFCDYTP